MNEQRKRIVIKKRTGLFRKMINNGKRNWFFILVTLGGLFVAVCVALMVTGNLNLGFGSISMGENSEEGAPQ